MPSRIQDVTRINYKNLLSHFPLYAIPTFQRAYSWPPREVFGLWESILANTENYYLGTLVAIQKTNRDKAALSIIDGQQRLITLSLTFIALRDFIKNLPNRRKGRIKVLDLEKKVTGLENFIFAKDLFSTSYDTRFVFRKENLSSIYKRLALGQFDFSDKDNLDALDGNQKRFIANYRVLYGLISKYFSEGGFEKNFSNLIEKFSGLEFILIICKSDSDVYQLFEGLNSTGLDLSVTDLVKNAIFQAIDDRPGGSEALGRAEQIWLEMEKLFESRDIKLFTKFLRHYWIATQGYVSTNDLFDTFKSVALNRSHGLSEIISFLQDLKDFSAVYVGIRGGEKSGLHNRVLKSKYNLLYLALDRFRLLDSEQIYEVILALYKKFIKDKAYTEKQFLLALENLWRFAFLIKFLSISPSSYERDFANFCKDLKQAKGGKIFRLSLEFCDVLRKKIERREQEFMDNFANDFQYVPNGNNALMAYVLKQIFATDSKNNDIEIKDPSLEHILPKEPSRWKLSVSEVEGYVNNIGNITLLNRRVNQALQNSDFDSKVEKVFAKDRFSENKQIKKFRDLYITNPEKAIFERGKYLGSKVYRMLAIK